MKPFLIIGGTGSIGRQITLQLLSVGFPVRVMTRKQEPVGLPSEVEIVRGDLTEPATLKPHLGNVDKVFLMWAALPKNIGPALNILTRVRRIVFLSNMAVRDDLEAQSNEVTTLHARLERLVAASGIEWTFLRPGPFASNARLWWASQVRAGDIVRWPYGTAASSLIHEYDIAAVAVHALCEDKHVGAKYILTGPQSLTHMEQVDILGDAIGRSLRFEEIPPETARQEVMGWMPPHIADMLLDAWPNLIGEPMIVTTTVADVTGTAPRSFHDWAIEHAAEFRH
jgi:uncharacterized protein YbjT (DUF2867 family)